jgi:hypothetical protein
MYFGNTNGILEFDGIKWTLTQTPKKSAIRALAIDGKNNTLYVGAANDFGYLKHESNGAVHYISLIDSTFKNYNPNISSVTVSESEGVIFESPEVLYVLKNDSVKEIKLSENQLEGIKKGTKFKGVFKAGEDILVNHTGIGIMTLKNGVLTINHAFH